MIEFFFIYSLVFKWTVEYSPISALFLIFETWHYLRPLQWPIDRPISIFVQHHFALSTLVLVLNSIWLSHAYYTHNFLTFIQQFYFYFLFFFTLFIYYIYHYSFFYFYIRYWRASGGQKIIFLCSMCKWKHTRPKSLRSYEMSIYVPMDYGCAGTWRIEAEWFVLPSLIICVMI